MQAILDFIKTHMLMVGAALLAAWFFLFSGKKGGRRSRARSRGRSYGRGAYKKARSYGRSRGRRY